MVDYVNTNHINRFYVRDEEQGCNALCIVYKKYECIVCKIHCEKFFLGCITILQMICLRLKNIIKNNDDPKLVEYF